MGRLDRHSNGVVIATVTTTVVIILVVFITTERNVFLSRKSSPASEPPTDEPPALPWALIDRQSYLSHRIVYTGGRHAKRLPGNVVPLHYDLEIEPHIGDRSSEEDTFSGKVTIRFRCIVATSTITMHSTPELKVSLGSRVTPGVMVRHASNSFYKMWAKSLTLHAYDEFLVIKLLGKLNANQTYLVTMHFHGKLGQDRGFYKYHYKVNGTLKHHKLVADHFQTTMPMSTYTLAFAVLNFTSQTNGNVTLWSLNGKAPYLKYALEVTPVLVKFYEELFGISYPLPKLNMISLPSFLANAMENWGLLTFHEQCLTFDETTTPHKKPLIAGLIAHEVAHQWFGDLVTMDWWGDMWLNEGFATYMQYTGAHFLEHQWEMAYLKKYSYGNVHQDQLFEELTLAQRGPVDVKRVMRNWTKHAGYPLVTVNRLYGKASAVFSQQDYLTLANAGETAKKLPKNKSSASWEIPITYTTKAAANFSKTAVVHWLSTDEATFTNIPDDNEGWLLVNVRRVGYFRVNYDKENWKRLLAQLRENPRIIHALNRAQLIDDALDLAKFGLMPYSTALEILETIQSEKNYLPWKSALDAIHELDFLIQKTNFYNKFKAFVRSLLSDRFQTFVRERKSIYNIRLTRESLSKNPWRARIVLCQGIRMNNGSHWDFIMNAVRDTKAENAKRAAVRALGCSRQTHQLLSLLNLTTYGKPSPVRAHYVYEALAETADGQRLAINYLLDNFPALVLSHGTGFTMRQIIQTVVTSVRNISDFFKMKQFFDVSVKGNHYAEKLEVAFSSALAEASKALAWTQRHADSVEDWLNQKTVRSPSLNDNLNRGNFTSGSSW
ncbi:hypothetical protein HPB47_014938, partial [Ixodes persulcatus]